jgi:multicomponent Na+:H+ antiporter subunit G
MLTFLLDALSWGLLLSGSMIVLVGGLGLIRLPDVFTRMHATGLTDTLGAGLILLGLVVQAGLTLVSVKLLLILFLLLFTGPTSTHALARAALACDVRPLLQGGADARRRSKSSTI